jgi:hypothetical protein
MLSSLVVYFLITLKVQKGILKSFNKKYKSFLLESGEDVF